VCRCGVEERRHHLGRMAWSLLQGNSHRHAVQLRLLRGENDVLPGIAIERDYVFF